MQLAKVYNGVRAQRKVTAVGTSIYSSEEHVCMLDHVQKQRSHVLNVPGGCAQSALKHIVVLHYAVQITDHARYRVNVLQHTPRTQVPTSARPVSLPSRLCPKLHNIAEGCPKLVSAAQSSVAAQRRLWRHRVDSSSMQHQL